MSRSDRSPLLRKSLAAAIAAAVAATQTQGEPVTLAPVPVSHGSATLSPNERATLANDLLAYRMARDSQEWTAGKARGALWLAVV
jgi:hypothetical protein